LDKLLGKVEIDNKKAAFLRFMVALHDVDPRVEVGLGDFSEQEIARGARLFNTLPQLNFIGSLQATRDTLSDNLLIHSSSPKAMAVATEHTIAYIDTVLDLAWTPKE
jgi:hypothetical protein